MLPHATSNIQPAMVIAGLMFEQAYLRQLTEDFLKLKRQFFPACRSAQYFDCMRVEIKGADLRKDIAEGNHTERRHAIGFLDKLVSLVQTYHGLLVARAWVKEIAQPMDGTAVYTFSVQFICEAFQHLLARVGDSGLVIADSRTPSANATVSHSIFTQKFKTGGDQYERLIEGPTFGHSVNHAGLQIADLLCSGILFPMTTFTYCTGHVRSVHVKPGFQRIKDRYGARMKALRYRYPQPWGRWAGGIVVSDRLGKKASSALFGTRPPANRAATSN